jgi:hypothetical protein
MPDSIDINCKHLEGKEVLLADGYYWIVCANIKCGRLLRCKGKYPN